MTASDTAERKPILPRLFLAGANLISAVVGLLVSRRVLCLGVVGLFALLAFNNWFRHPLSSTRDSFIVSIFPGDPKAIANSEVPSPGGVIVPSSPGVILLTSAACAAVIVLIWPGALAQVVGLLIAIAVACQIAVWLNNPGLIDALDHETHLSKNLTALLGGTVEPDVAVGVRARGGFSGAYVGRASVLQDTIYLPTTRVAVLGLAVLCAVCAGRATYARRLRGVLLWTLAGIAAGGLLTWDRCRAEAHWFQAVDAEIRGHFALAKHHAKEAVRLFPLLNHTQRTWLLLGKVDYETDRVTSAARFFVASQWALTGETRRAVDELQALAAAGEPVPEAGHWLARQMSEMAFELYEDDDLDGAESAWELALPFSDPADLDQLCLAVLAARRVRVDVAATAGTITDLLPRVADRSVRAALLAVLGDCYFQNGRMNDARDCYAQSLTLYTLPKQINFRAVRGLLGM